MKKFAKIGFIITILSICLASCGQDDGPALPNVFPGDIIGIFHLVDEGTGKDFFSSNPGYSFEEAIYILQGPTGATLEFDNFEEFQEHASFKVTEVDGNTYINIPVRVDRPSSSSEILIRYSGEDIDTLSISYEASAVKSDYYYSSVTHYLIEKVALQFNGQVFEYDDLIGLSGEERREIFGSGYKGEFYKAPKE